MFDDLFESLSAAARPHVAKKEWMATVTMGLVTTSTITRVVDECIASPHYAIDLETTGLDNRVVNGETIDKIVGICLSPDGVRGYYIPVLHTNNLDICIPASIVHREMSRLVASDSIAIFHNGKFDHEFLQFNGWGSALGEWDNPRAWEDSLILTYLRNTRERNKGLKHLSKVELNLEMIELDELFTKEEAETTGKNFSVLDPSWEPCIWYACADAICTYRLYFAIRDAAILPTESGLPTQKPLYEVEKLCIAATRWMERLRVPIDRNKVRELIQIGQQEWYPALQSVYNEASSALGRDITPGYFRLMSSEGSFKYDPNNVEVGIKESVDAARVEARRLRMDKEDNSGKVPTMRKRVASLVEKKPAEDVDFPITYDVLIPDQLGLLLRELGISGLKATEKSGQIKTSKDELERVLEAAGEDFPFVSKVKRFREVAKAISSNLLPLYDYTAPDKSPDGRIRINFEALKTDTGRFSTPAREGNKDFTGTIPWNLQSIPSGGKADIPECMLRLRECVRTISGWMLFAIDYSGQELRVVTNLSGEPKWVAEFFRCSECDHRFDMGGIVPPPPEPPPPFCPKCGSDKIGDLHTLTALSLHGDAIKADKAKFKQLRKEAKCVHPDTMLRTGNGLFRIGMLPTGNKDTFCAVQNIQVSGPNQTFVPVLETYNGGDKELFHVVTRRGVLTCSAEHRFQLANGSLQSIATGLTKGSILSDPEAHKDFDRDYPILAYHPYTGVPLVQVPTNAKTAYVAGLHAGDGASSTSSAHIVHGSVDKVDPLGIPHIEWQQILMQACQEAGLRPTPHNKGINLGSRQVLRWMQVLGMVQCSRRTFRVPDWIWQAGREALCHYLGGLIDTDGSVTKGGDIRIVTKDMIFAGQVAEAFRAVGCRPSVAPSYNKTYDRWYVKISIKRCEGRILEPYMRHPGKVARLSETIAEYPAWNNDVLLIIPAGVHNCVDLHVDSESHLYVGNGLVIHNSVNFGLCYGGGGQAVQRATGCSKEEGWRVKRTFDKTYFTLFKWWEQQHVLARQTKHVLTAFNRRYPLPDIDSPIDGFRAKAERNAVNGPVQGCLHPDARVTTRSGIHTVKDLWDSANAEGPVRFDVWTGRGWSQARPLKSGFKRHVTTVFEDGGRIDTSPEHLFRTWRNGDLDWVRQTDLLNGDWVARDRTRQSANSEAQCEILVREYGEPLPEEFGYDYTRVTEKIDHGVYVDMYDVEVLDDDHAFSCDGVIVHNTGADIMKFAMGLIYREFKKRGWLYRVKMIITIHDELVFEIEDSLTEEAIPVITEIMLKKVVAKLPWRIPLTVDIECGHDWTVPWNFTRIQYGKDKMPPEIAHILGPIIAKMKGGAVGSAAPVSTAATEATVAPAPSTTAAAPTTEVAGTTAAVVPATTSMVSEMSMPSVSRGDVFVHRVPSGMLTMKTATRLARVIQECVGRGTNPLRVESDQGLVLFYDPNTLVNPMEFTVLMNRRGSD